MLQSPYFFFDVVYLHNGVEEQGDDTSWRVSEPDLIWFIACFRLLCHSLVKEVLITLLHKTHIFIGSQIYKATAYTGDIVLLAFL